MNQTLDTILTRRSCRSYQEKQVAEQELQTVLQAGLYAPSAKNEQSWHFLVVQRPEVMARLRELGESLLGLPKGQDPFYGAPTLVLVFALREATDPICDGSLALGNMMLAAHALGLGSCWINCVKRIFKTEEGQRYQDELGVPSAKYQPVGSCILGYPAESSKPASLRREGTISYLR